MHEYKRFVQEQMDARGWRQADLVRASGLGRALVSRILRDERPRLGQMPDESTMAGLAKAFQVPTETVRTAAARALRGYTDDGEALTTDLSAVSIDALLMEIRRRVQASENPSAQDPQDDPPADGEARPGGAPMKLVPAAGAEDEPEEPLPYDPEELHAARDVSGPSRGQWLRERQDRDAEAGDADGPEEGA